VGNKFLPSITSALPNDVRQFLQRVREALTASGDKRLLTAGDLQNAGLAAVNPRTGDLEANVTESSGCSIPGAPTGLIVTGAMTTVLLEWEEVSDADCHSYTEVWRSDVDDLGVAVLIGTARGVMYPDAVGSQASAYYWIRHVNIDGNEGPYNATGGTVGETAPDPAYLIEQMTGIADNQPYVYVDAAYTNNGVTVPKGTYIKDALIANGAISNAKIGVAAIDSAKIADASIISAKIDNAAVTNAKIANAAISSAQIQDAAILNAKIADAAITNAKIGLAAINTANIADAAINSAKVESLDANKINADTLSAISADMGTITAGKLRSSDGKFVIDLTNKYISIEV